MFKASFFFLAAFVFAAPVSAQVENRYNGEWVVSLDGKRTADIEGTVAIKDNGGTWNIVARVAKNPCVGRAYPITVDKVSADELAFTVNRAQTLAGCKDSTYTFKKVDEKTIKGALAEGRPMTLMRN